MTPTSTAMEATSTGKTRLRVSLEGAAARRGPSIGQWLEFPGYSLARTVSQLGEDVSYPSIGDKQLLTVRAYAVGINRLRTREYRRQRDVPPSGRSLFFRGITDCPYSCSRAVDDEESS